MENSKIINLGSGSPVVGISGIVHGDEICGKEVLDELQHIKPEQGTLKLIYANLAAEKIGKRKVETDLNRSFPGKQNGLLEERIAFGLRKDLAACDYFIDIHASCDETPAFVISRNDNTDFYDLGRATGLDKYCLMTPKFAKGGTITDFVNNTGGKSISFEAGLMTDQESIITAKQVVNNFLKTLGIIKGTPEISKPKKYIIDEVITAPSEDFVCYKPKCFELLKAGTPYGRLGDKEYSLDRDCFPVLSVSKPFGPKKMVFLAAVEYKKD